MMGGGGLESRRRGYRFDQLGQGVRELIEVWTDRLESEGRRGKSFWQTRGLKPSKASSRGAHVGLQASTENSRSSFQCFVCFVAFVVVFTAGPFLIDLCGARALSSLFLFFYSRPPPPE